jgi:hypothetical protein
MDSTKWWKRLRCDCFTEGIVQDDHQEFTEMLIPDKNDISNMTESTVGESAWDEDDIIVNDTQTNEPLPQQQQQEESLFFGMLAPVTSKGVMELVDMAKTKFMSSSEINYPSSLTGSSLVNDNVTERRVEVSWSKVAAKLRSKRQAQSRHGTPAGSPITADKNAPKPTGPFLLGIAFPHPAYMSSQDPGGKEEMPPPPIPLGARYFKTSSNSQHPSEELISKKTKVVRL